MLEYLFVYYFHICNKLKSIIKYYAKPPLNSGPFLQCPWPFLILCEQNTQIFITFLYIT